jgi:hypothetical protein
MVGLGPPEDPSTLLPVMLDARGERNYNYELQLLSVSVA